MESLQCHTQAISSFQNIFPSLDVSNIEPGNSLHNILDALIKNLPRPTNSQISHTIKNMKNFVDYQERRIQKNMMEIQEEQISLEDKLVKKLSITTNPSQDNWISQSVENIGENWWNKDHAFQNSQDLERNLSSFLN